MLGMRATCSRSSEYIRAEVERLRELIEVVRCTLVEEQGIEISYARAKAQFLRENLEQFTSEFAREYCLTHCPERRACRSDRSRVASSVR